MYAEVLNLDEWMSAMSLLESGMVEGGTHLPYRHKIPWS